MLTFMKLKSDFLCKKTQLYIVLCSNYTEVIIDSQVCSLSFLKANRDSRSNCKNVHLRCLIFLNADLDIAGQK